MRGRFFQQNPAYDRLVLIKAGQAQTVPAPTAVSRSNPARLGIIFLLCFAVAMLSGSAYWQYRTISSLQQRIARLSQEGKASAGKPQAAKPPVSVKRTVICPLCRGEKFVVYGPDPLHRKKRKCPVCLGAGYRTVEVLSGQRVCPDCHGMGIVYYPFDRWSDVQTAECVRCDGKGVVATLEEIGKTPD